MGDSLNFGFKLLDHCCFSYYRKKCFQFLSGSQAKTLSQPSTQDPTTMKPFDRRNRGLEFLWARFDSSTNCSFKIQIHLLIKELCYNIYIFLNTYNIYLSCFFSHHHQLIGKTNVRNHGGRQGRARDVEAAGSSGRSPRVPMTPDELGFLGRFRLQSQAGAARSLNQPAAETAATDLYLAHYSFSLINKSCALY